MTTPTLDRPVLLPQASHGETNDDDGLAHKFRHDDIERSLATGTVVVALCGYRQRLTRPNQGNRPACSPCMELVEMADSLGS